MHIAFWGAQEKQTQRHDSRCFFSSIMLIETMYMQSAEILAQSVMQIVKFIKFQVGIISLSALYCKSIVKMKSPMDI